MPGPTTEILNEDLRELKADMKEVKAELGRLAISQSEMRAELRKEVQSEIAPLAIAQAKMRAELKQEIQSAIAPLTIAQVEMRAELRFTLGLAKWGAGLVIAAALGSGISGVWWASAISAEVRHLADIVAKDNPAPTPGRAVNPAPPDRSPLESRPNP